MSEITANCVFWILVLCSLNGVWLSRILKYGVYSREIFNMFSSGQVSEL